MDTPRERLKPNRSENSSTVADVRVRKLQTGTRVLKATQVVFAIGGSAFALAAIFVAFQQAPDIGILAAIGVAVLGSMFGLVLAVGAWTGLNWFMRMINDNSIRIYGPQFELDLTGKNDYWNNVAADPVDPSDYAPSLADIDFETELSAPIVADGLAETLEIPAAMLFTKHDLRGQLDLVVGAKDGFSPDRLTRAILQHLTIGFEVSPARMSPSIRSEHDTDSAYSVWLTFSVSSLIGQLNNPDLNQWIKQKAADPGTVHIYWDDQLLGKVHLVIAD